ncbi:MAG TPA: protein kinase [Vicinamibacteria bacterium]|nr:protein kinase [Vicinamibacteria bacterium]
MGLTPGTHVGPYEIAAPLGAGGMGEVYRARDPRIGREVALKVLPESFSADPDRLRRFEQEARATGQLNHPNILAVFDVGTVDGTPYVVSELLEGDTLRERIGGTALPVRKAIDYATQMARGLAAAHEKGVVHRDLKPDNVFVTKDGRVKILDFGLAKLVGGEILTEADTHTAGVPGTDAGKVLGTVGYMSPEQVRAQPVDHRSDIFSFGSVLYEMLAGRRAFRGASNVETMNAILKEDPPELSETNRHLPPALERIVSHCLEKNAEERFQSARDIAFDLEQLSGSAAHAVLPGVARKARPWQRGAAAALLALGCVALGYWAAPRRKAEAVVGFKPITFQNGLVNDARFAPDGKTVVYQAQWPGAEPGIYVTQPGSPESRSLGLRGDRLGSVSRSGELLIGRSAGVSTTLAQAPLGGGAPRDILENVSGADWAPDGASIAVLRDSGATTSIEFPIGKPLYESVSLRHLRVSPRGELLAFSEHPFSGDFRGDIAIVDLAGKKTTLSANWSDIRGVAWSRDGQEVWFTGTRAGAENSLWAVGLEGTLRPVFRAPGSLALHDVGPDGRVLVSVQRRRPVLFGLRAGEAKERDLSWLDYGIVVDISGDGRTLLFQEQGEGGGAEYSTYIRGMDGSLPVRLGKGAAVALSPDGRQALVLSITPPMQALLLPTGPGPTLALPRGPLVQIHGGSFLPDGKRVVLSANEAGRAATLYIQDVAGGEPKAISKEPVSPLLFGFPPTVDGTSVVGVSDRRVALFPIAGGEPQVVRGAELDDVPLRVSGDGRFLFVNSQPGRRARIFRVDLRSGQREPWREIGRDGGSPAGFVGALAIAPDGKSYAYTFRDDSSTLYVAEGLR